jgi:hypothetical protein
VLRRRNETAGRRPGLALATTAILGGTALAASFLSPASLTAQVTAVGGAAGSAAAAGSRASAALLAVSPAVSAPAATLGTTVPGAPHCPMFPADNVWNTNISKLPVDPRSAAWLRSMDAGSTYLHPDFGPNTGGYPYGIPFKVVTNKHRLVKVHFSYASQSNRGPYPFGSDTPIEGGKQAGGDRHAIMINSQTCTLYELWEARYSASRPTAGSGAIWKLTSNALRPAGWTSADAAGLPILPGLLNFSQVQAAVKSGQPITHAIRFTADRTRSGYIWPARHEAGSGSSRNLPPMGARFRLKASFGVRKFCDNATTRYCRDAKAILREMQNYGLILADNGSNWYFQGSAYPRWPNGLIALLKGIPARSFQAIDEGCLRVHRNSGLATAKPGCPIG